MNSAGSPRVRVISGCTAKLEAEFSSGLNIQALILRVEEFEKAIYGTAYTFCSPRLENGACDCTLYLVIVADTESAPKCNSLSAEIRSSVRLNEWLIGRLNHKIPAAISPALPSRRRE